MNRLLALALVLAAACLPAVVPACAGAGACTEIGCESQTSVVYDGFTVSGPYDLNLDLGGEKIFVRCNDDGSMEAVQNPDFVECGPGGFEIVGPMASHTSILVTVFDIENDLGVVVNHSVQLAVAPDGVLTPNGPDCEPVCYIRTGVVLIPG